MADFYHQRINAKGIENVVEPREILRRLVKGKRELQQDGAEAVHAPRSTSKAGTHNFHIFDCGVVLMRKFLPELRGKEEARIGRHVLEPLCGEFWLQWVVKRSIDFDGVKKIREISSFVKSLLAARRLKIPFRSG